MNALEIRFPVSPEWALLMTWIDEPDPDEPRRGAAHHAPNINAFTRAHADKQWMHQPGMTPRFAHGNLLPISTEFATNYAANIAAASRRRQTITPIVNADLGRLADGTEEVTILEMPPNNPSG